jgi:NTE family protein
VSFGLVLGAGGQAGGAFHAGVVRALRDYGLEPSAAEVIVGTSAGSLMAASLRRRAPSRPVADPPAGSRTRRRLPNRTSALELYRRPRQLFNALLLAPELASGRRSIEFLRDGMDAKHGAWPQAPTWIVAVRRSDGRRVVFGKDGEPVTDLASACAASCAIPGYFSAIEIDGTSYVDGGVHSPTNADLLAGRRLDVVVISSPMSMPLTRARPRVDLPIRLLFHGYLREEVWALRRRGTTVVVLEPDRAVLDVMGLNMMDGRNIAEIEERAYDLARVRLRDVPVADAVRPKS